jgi:hypothetical protein
VHNTCGPSRYYFLNIATRKMRSATQTATTVLDLDSPTLLRRLCAPLRIESGAQASFPPAFTFYSDFAVAQEQSGIYVERCGSDMRIPLAVTPYGGYIVANDQAAAMCTNAGVSGVFMPSRRRFELGRPFDECPVLGPRNLYVIDVHGRLWGTPFPPPGGVARRR